MYKIAYKTVTELAWRCCPGYQGYDCMEVKDMKQIQVERLPRVPSASGHNPVQQGEKPRKCSIKICETKLNKYK